MTHKSLLEKLIYLNFVSYLAKMCFASSDLGTPLVELTGF